MAHANNLRRRLGREESHRDPQLDRFTRGAKKGPRAKLHDDRKPDYALTGTDPLGYCRHPAPWEWRDARESIARFPSTEVDGACLMSRMV